MVHLLLNDCKMNFYQVVYLSILLMILDVTLDEGSWRLICDTMGSTNKSVLYHMLFCTLLQTLVVAQLPNVKSAAITFVSSLITQLYTLSRVRKLAFLATKNHFTVIPPLHIESRKSSTATGKSFAASACS